jgi:hypothetical protein
MEIADLPDELIITNLHFYGEPLSNISQNALTRHVDKLMAKVVGVGLAPRHEYIVAELQSSGVGDADLRYKASSFVVPLLL